MADALRRLGVFPLDRFGSLALPIEHAERLRDALEANHAPLTWLFYKDEAHGWYNPETRAGFYTAMVTFLDANTSKESGADKP